ncbi:MAG TPA: septum formation initiator family protein [Caldisericia bacterium]|nr:septum formation initiator family protein [Caldisericia bacterium]HXK51314.1 septum formation initiator family protein [Caldisericia bacterium]
MRKKREKPGLLAIVVRIVIVCVVLFIGLKMIQYIQLSSQLRALQRDQVIFQSQIENLKEKIEFAETDYFIEKMAREESDLAKPGDFVIKFKSK